MMNNSSLLALVDDEIYATEVNSESEDDLDSLEDKMLKSIFLLPLVQEPRTTIENYLQIAQTYNDYTFKSHFRITRQLANDISGKFYNSEDYQNLLTARSRIAISAEEHVLIFLWFAAHQSASYRDVADRWNLSISSLFDVVSRVSKFLCRLKSELIKMPNHVEKQRSKNFFYEKYGLPNIIGALDGCHIKIDKPAECHMDYFNRKHFYSIILQGVCNEERKFIDVFIGYPGSVHDARVFKNSQLFNRHIKNLSVGEDYILADSAYPLLSTVITPYRDNGHLTINQKKFNNKLSSSRVFIEHTFGLLKQRFRQLYHVKLRDIKRTCQFIMACCVLHNLAVEDDFEFSISDDPYEDQPETETLLGADSRTNDGVRHRDRLATTLESSEVM